MFASSRPLRLPGGAVADGRIDHPREFFRIVRLARQPPRVLDAEKRLGQQHHHRVGVADRGDHEPVGVEGVGRQHDLPARQAARPRFEAVRVIEAAANPRPGGVITTIGMSKPPPRGPALIAGDLEHVHHVEGVIGELDLANRPPAGVGDPHRGADDAALVERRVPGRPESLRDGEHSTQRRPDILAKDVRDAEVLLAVMQCHAHGLGHRRHLVSQKALTTETQRTQRRHRESISVNSSLLFSLCPLCLCG